MENKPTKQTRIMRSNFALIYDGSRAATHRNMLARDLDRKRDFPGYLYHHLACRYE